MPIILMRLFSIIVLAALPGLSPAEEANGPALAADEVRFHAGQVVQGTTVSHVFKIRNAGSRTLVIERINAG